MLLQHGLLKLRQKDPHGARAFLEEILHRNPEDLRAWDALVRSYVMQKQAPTALRKLREYAAQRPDSPRLQYFLGQSLMADKNTKEARTAFEAAKSADPGLGAAELALAHLDFDEGQWESARARLSSLFAAKTDSPSARLLMAGVERATGNLTAAIDQYRKVLELDPYPCNGVEGSGLLARPTQSSSLTKLSSMRNRPWRSLPITLTSTIRLVGCTHQKGAYRSARQHFETAVAKEATARRKYHLAMACFQLGDQKGGQHVLDAALQSNPNLPEAKAALELRAAISR